MKTCLYAVAVLGTLHQVVAAQSPAEQALLEKLSQDPEQVATLDAVLKNAEQHSALLLFIGSSTALKRKRLEDCAFLFYAGQLRARFDKVCFPPVGQGGNSPFVAYAALSHQLGSVINPTVMAQPKVFAKAIDRVKKWTPRAPEEYDPGYEFADRETEEDAHKRAEKQRREFISRMSGLSTLLNNAEYFAAFRVLQAYNLGAEDGAAPPTKDEMEKATKVMKGIERETGIRGFFSKPEPVSKPTGD